MNAERPPDPLERSDQALVLALAAAVRTASYYEPANAVMRQACASLAALLAAHYGEDGTVTVGVHSHSVFVGKSRVRSSAATYARFSYLVDLFTDWGITTLTFFAGVTEGELLQLVLTLARERPTTGTGPAGSLAFDLDDLLAKRGVTGVRADLLSGSGAPTATAKVEAYAAAMQLGEELAAEKVPTDRTQARRLRRVTQAVVDQTLRDPSSLLALTTIKDFDRYLLSHSTNVAILAVILGQRLGLSKARLGELCIAAFLHDSGKLEVLPEVLNKPGSLDEQEWEEVRRHPVLAAYAILGTGRLSPSVMRAVVVAFEHHLREDMSGYPRLRTGLKRRMTLFGKIVAIVDCYDALTTARSYREYNFTPHEAILYLIANAGTHFDRKLVKTFVEIMGLYPPGTLVELTSGEFGLVCAAPAVGLPFDRPRVRILTGDRVGSVVDLSEREGETYCRSVARVINPANLGQVPAVDPSIFEPSS